MGKLLQCNTFRVRMNANSSNGYWQTAQSLQLSSEKHETHWMFDNCSKLDMKVCREPVTGLEVSEQLLRSWTSKSVALHFLAKKFFLLE